MTQPGRSAVDLNRSNRTTLDTECSKLSAGFVAKLYHTQGRDDAGGCHPHPGAFSFGEKGGAGEGLWS